MDHAVIKNFGILFLHYNRDIKGHLYMKSNFCYKLQLKAKQDELRRKLPMKRFFFHLVFGQYFTHLPILMSIKFFKPFWKCQNISA